MCTWYFLVEFLIRTGTLCSRDTLLCGMLGDYYGRTFLVGCLVTSMSVPFLWGAWWPTWMSPLCRMFHDNYECFLCEGSFLSFFACLLCGTLGGCHPCRVLVAWNTFTRVNFKFHISPTLLYLYPLRFGTNYGFDKYFEVRGKTKLLFTLLRGMPVTHISRRLPLYWLLEARYRSSLPSCVWRCLRSWQFFPCPAPSTPSSRKPSQR